MNLGKFSPADLAQFLALYPKLLEGEREARDLLKEKGDMILAPDMPGPTWSHLYELPAKEHFITGMAALGAQDQLKQLAQSSNQIQEILYIAESLDEDEDEEDWEPTDEEREALRKALGVVFAMTMSVLKSLRSLMVFGVYLNDLVALVRAGGAQGDKALLQAVKIDPTVLACPSVNARISRAILLDDHAFLAKVHRAMEGKLTKREQRNYQYMRIVLEVLHEAGAPKLSQDDLYTLFVEELKLVRGERDADEGDVANALRQFAYQFMKQKAVSQNA
ncbi:MAG: hypothetical protein BroJett006_22600 [Betaproteobacteria bacterium]|nr:MAG: hypothetical protein BroJett006_22600 [Betaproteobacteria bacterium]